MLVDKIHSHKLSNLPDIELTNLTLLKVPTYLIGKRFVLVINDIFERCLVFLYDIEPLISDR